MFKTHLMFGVFLGLLFLKYFEINNGFWFFVVVCFFSVFPDIDFYRSKIGKKVKPLSWLINLFLGHRGLMHSLVAALFFYFLFYVLFGASVGLGAFVGYCGHLVLDSLTPKGIRPFYPFKPKLNGFLKGNSLIDYLFFFLLFFGSVYLFFVVVF